MKNEKKTSQKEKKMDKETYGHMVADFLLRSNNKIEVQIWDKRSGYLLWKSTQDTVGFAQCYAIGWMVREQRKAVK